MSKKILRNCNQIAKELGHPAHCFNWAVDQGLIPGPDVFLGNQRGFYSTQQYGLLKTYFNRPKSGYNLADIARMIGVNHTTLRKYRANKELPKPTGYRGRRPIWSKNQVNEIKELCEKLKDRREKSRIPDGYFSSCSAARYLSMPRITFQSWQNNKTIEKPARAVEGYALRFYSLKDIEKIKEVKKDYFASQKIK